MDKIITFDQKAKREILRFFDKDIDNEDYIIEKDTLQRILTTDGEFLALDDFAGVKKGSLVFIKSDINSIIELADSVA